MGKSETIREQRTRLGLSQEKLSRMSDISQGIVSRIELRKDIPTVKQYGKLRGALNRYEAKLSDPKVNERMNSNELASKLGISRERVNYYIINAVPDNHGFQTYYRGKEVPSNKRYVFYERDLEVFRRVIKLDDEGTP